MDTSLPRSRRRHNSKEQEQKLGTHYQRGLARTALAQQVEPRRMRQEAPGTPPGEVIFADVANIEGFLQ